MSGGAADNPPAGMLTHLLCALTRLVSRRPVGTLGLVLLSVLACAGGAAWGLKFKTSRSDLIDPEAPFQQRWLTFTQKFGDQSDIVVVVEADDPAKVRSVLDALGNQLLQEPHLFAKVSWKFDPALLQRKGLQYLPPAQLEAGLQRLETYGPILAGHWNRAGLESYCRRLAIHARWARDQHREGEEEQATAQAGRLTESLTSFFAQATAVQTAAASGTPAADLASAFTGGGFVSPWPEVFPQAAAGMSDLMLVRYQVTTDGRMGFLTTVATAGEQDFSGTSPTLGRLRDIITAAESQFSGVTFGLTGIPVLESDEMQRSQADMTWASVISFGGVALILVLGFRGLRHPLLGLLMLLVGLAWSIGYTTLVVGHLNILSVSFAAILIGLGIDFAVHYLSRYLELRHQGADLLSALEQTSATVGTGLVTAAMTTSLAFLCAAFTRFLGVAELGIIAGGGIVICAAAAVLVLVPLIRLADGHVEPRRLPAPFQGVVLRWLTQRFPRTATIACVVAIAVVVLQAVEWRDGGPQFKVEYDSNLLNLQAADVESVQVQERVFEHTQGSLLFAVSLADSPDEAQRLAEKFTALESVAHVEHLGRVIPQYPPSETALLVQAIHARLANLPPLPRELPAIDPLAIGQGLEELLQVLRESSRPDALAAAEHIDAFLNQFEQVPLEQQVELLGNYQSAMVTALRTQFERLGQSSDPAPVTVHDLAPGVRERFVSPEGEWMLRIFPREQLWDEPPLERFVHDVRQIDPEATGTPLQNYEAAREIRTSYLAAAQYAFLAVVMVLMVDSLASGPLCIALLSPLIVVAFGVVTLCGPNQSLDLRWMLGLYVGLAALVATIFDFVNVRNIALMLAPPVLGLAIVFGVLGFLGEHLNPANIIVLPLLLGIGVDYGVLMVHDFRGQTDGYRTSSSTINAVVLTSLTSMVGFGSLLTASHRGLQSLGLVLVVGLAGCLFVALVALPAVLTWIAGRTPQWSSSDAAEPVAVEPLAATLPLAAERPETRLVGRTLRAAS